jgi:Zn-dependent metalloprotease
MMKSKIHYLLWACLCLGYTSYGQESYGLRDLIRGEKGLSREITRIPEGQQLPFNPENAASSLGLPAGLTLQPVSTEKDHLGTNYRFIQSLHGVKIENSMYVVQTRDGKAAVLSGVILTGLLEGNEYPTDVKMSDEQAVRVAIGRMNAKKYAWEDLEMERQLRESDLPGNRPFAELVWFSGTDKVDLKELRLAYKVTVYALEPLSRKAYFIDAVSGKILGERDLLHYSDATGTAATAYSGTQSIHSDLYNGSYRLRDLTKGSGVVTLHGESGTHPDYTSASANWSYSTNDKYALDAHYGVSETYRFFFQNFNRNSINNAGFQLKSYVNETSTTNNAYWDGSIMHFGVRSATYNYAGITAIDIAGHELTHGLTQYTSNLNYSYESGAINESMSDIFGKSVQFWSKPADVNWTLSNDMAWNIRNMANPNQYSQPDCYKGTYWYTGTGDNGGVHYNSGVGNYFFYLLVNGGSGTNDKGTAFGVTGLGLGCADSIIYRSETAYLTSTSNYLSWRNACISAATDLYGAGSVQVIQVTNAWNAVNVPDVSGSGSTGGTTCTDTYESNNSQSAAKTIAVNTDINAAITTSTDVDWFKFTTVSPNTNIKVILNNLPSGTDYDMKLYGSTGALLGTSQLSSTNPETIIRNTTTATTYYVRIYPYSGYSASCYTLRANVSSTVFRLRQEPGEAASSESFDFLLYPNPASDLVTLEYHSGSEAELYVRMFDLTGRNIYQSSQQVKPGETRLSIPVSDLTNGVYFVETLCDGVRTTKRLVVD